MVKNVHIFSISYYKIDKIQIHKLISFLKKELSISIKSLDINFIGKEDIHKINRKHLKHDYSTDIITFNYTGNNNELDGEILISIDDASSNAKKYNVTLLKEIYRLVIHGILHLIGLDDKTEKEKIIMRSKENLILKKFNKILTN